MKRIKAINGQTIFERSEREMKENSYRYAIYFSFEVRELGLRNCDSNWDTDTLREAEEWCESYDSEEIVNLRKIEIG